MTKEQIYKIIIAIVTCITTISGIILAQSCTASMSISKYNNGATQQTTNQSVKNDSINLKLK